ncbi:hypothetical protein V1511DRAFT_496131 [Dipodascopsis uninucleata]
MTKTSLVLQYILPGATLLLVGTFMAIDYLDSVSPSKGLTTVFPLHELAVYKRELLPFDTTALGGVAISLAGTFASLASIYCVTGLGPLCIVFLIEGVLFFFLGLFFVSQKYIPNPSEIVSDLQSLGLINGTDAWYLFDFNPANMTLERFNGVENTIEGLLGSARLGFLYNTTSGLNHMIIGDTSNPIWTALSDIVYGFSTNSDTSIPTWLTYVFQNSNIGDFSNIIQQITEVISLAGKLGSFITGNPGTQYCFGFTKNSESNCTDSSDITNGMLLFNGFNEIDSSCLGGTTCS